MMVFVDTSALYAVLDADDQYHAQAREQWIDLLTNQTRLVCTNYVVVEAFALTQHRLGMGAVRTLQEDIVPMLQVTWIDEGDHEQAVSAVLAADRRQLTLVDCANFNTMRELGIKESLCLRRSFRRAGLRLHPQRIVLAATPPTWRRGEKQ